MIVPGLRAVANEYGFLCASIAEDVCAVAGRGLYISARLCFGHDAHNGSYQILVAVDGNYIKISTEHTYVRGAQGVIDFVKVASIQYA